MTETLEGVVDRIAFENPESGWCVLKVTVEDRVEAATAVGPLTGTHPGETIRLVGTWEHDKRFGEQFRAETWVPVEPATVLGIRKFLGSGLVEGIGQVMADRLVDAFGVETLEVIEKKPERLTEVEGIGPKRKARILEAWTEMRAVREVMVFLQSHGISSAHAARIYRTYGAEAVAVVRDNPYRLAADVAGIGFATADRIAEALGVDRGSPERAQAGVLHTLDASGDSGHVYLPRVHLIETATALLEVDDATVEQAVAGLAEAEAVIDDDGRVYTPKRYLAETELADRLHAIASTPPAPIDIDADKALEWLQTQQQIELAPEQLEAVRRAITDNVLVITGGPGTGKTTVVNSIIRILEQKRRRILLCAPTGRAAKRMKEATDREAKTIHRLLEFNPRTGDFTKSEDDPLDADVVIVDETSMVDTALMRDLLHAIPTPAQVVLVGDIDQLPSVGPGSVLADIIGSGIGRVIQLEQIFRQAEQSLIVLNAHRVNAGELPESAGSPEGDFFLIVKDEPDDVLSTIKTLLSSRIPRRFGMDPIEDVQVLTPMHRGVIGTTNLNTELQALLNPHGDTMMRGSRLLRVGDKVMQVRNNYDRDVFNGDLGRVSAINQEDRCVEVIFDGRAVDYEFADLDELTLAYACSIHKSQGSEYPAVVIPVHTQHYVMLRRNLLYTGISRGKKLVVLVGTRRALKLCVDNNRVQPRHTHLASRLRD